MALATLKLIAMLASSHWYSSSVTLTIAAIIVSLLVGLAGALTTYLVSTPRRQLLFRLESCTSLLSTSPDARKELKVLYGNEELADPHILNVKLISRSREDIASEAFDQSRPIVLDVGMPIIALLPMDAKSEVLPKFKFEGTAVKVGPDLIKRRQRMSFTLLADGPNAQLSCESHLVNVKVQEEPPDEIIRRRVNWIFNSIEWGAVLVGGAIVVFGNDPYKGYSRVANTLLIALVIIVGITMVLELLAKRWYRR